MYWWLIQHLVIVTLLATLVLVAGRVFRLSPAVRHALWVVVLIKLMMPPVIIWPWAVPQYDAVAKSTPGTTTIVDVSEIALKPGDAATPVNTKTTIATAPSSAASISATGTALRWASENHRKLVFGLWFAGSIIVAGIHLTRIVRYRRYVAKRQEVPQWIVEESRAIADRLGVAAPDTYAVHGLHSPLVHHFGRAVLLIPQALLDLIPRERWQCILAHELAHLRRGDHVVRWLELFATIVWWWNPVFWLVQRHLHEAAEEACDAYVVWALPNSRRAYAETLIDVSELISRKEVQVTALGIRNGVRMDFERRLEHILHGTAMPRLGFSALIMLALILGLSLPAWTQSGPATPPPSAAAAAPAPDQPALPEANAPVAVQPAPPATELGEKSKIDAALDSPVSIEFQDTHITQICDFIAEYIDTNIVIDYRFVEPVKRPAPPSAPEALTTPGIAQGQKAPENEATTRYVTDGILPYVKLENVSLRNALQALLAPLELTYEAHPAFIWITAKSQLGKDDFSDPITADEKMKRLLDSPISVEFKEEHIANISDFISEYMEMNIVIDKRAVQPPLVQMPTAAPKPGAPTPQTPGAPAQSNVSPAAIRYWAQVGDRIVSTGYVPWIKLGDTSAREALKALLVPLNLYYKIGPGFVFISTPELLKTTDFAPQKPEQKSEAKVEAESSTQPFKVAGFFTDSATSEQSVFLQFQSGLTKKYTVGEKFEEYEVTKIDSANHTVVVRSEKDGHEYTASSEKPGREDAKPGGERLLYDKRQGPVMTHKRSMNPTLIAPTLEDE